MPRRELNRLERAIAYMAPGWAANREAARARVDYYNNVRSSFGGSSEGYKGSASTRLSDQWDPIAGGGLERMPRGQEAKRLRQRARNLERNNYIAVSLLNSSVNFTIGRGTRIEAMTIDQDFNKKAEVFWLTYWNGQPEITGIMTGPEMERTAYRTMLRDGDVGTILLASGRVQFIEGHLIDTPFRRPPKTLIIDGIQMAKNGRPIIYWVRSMENGRTGFAAIRSENMIFVAKRRRFNQVRGETSFAQGFQLFEQAEGYLDSVVVAARMAASFGLLLREQPAKWNNLPQGRLAGGKKVVEFELEPGLVKRIGVNDEVTQIKPEQPTTQMDQMLTALVRFAGLNFDLPLELSMMDFKRTNYSSARAALIVAGRASAASHSSFTSRFISPIYRWRISKAIKAGDLPMPSDERPFAHRVLQDPHQYLDPVKEIQGEMMAIAGGLKSHGEALRGRGQDFTELVAKRKQELEAATAAGFAFDLPTQTRTPL